MAAKLSQVSFADLGHPTCKVGPEHGRKKSPTEGRALLLAWLMPCLLLCSLLLAY